jgi:tRNA dimethylallyltransferase
VSRHLALVGPTASGKSAVALAIARTLGDCEIVSLDSMQVYRGLDIGTAKASTAERDEVTHHLVDVADPSEEWSVARTQYGARAAIAGIEARGKRAMLVGGTGLYVRAVVDDLEIPSEDPAVREALLEETATERGLTTAYARLQEIDPAGAARIEPRNRRRIVRALEVHAVTGRPFSSFGPGFDSYEPPRIDVRLVGIWLPRAELGRRIDARLAAMRAGGFVDEVKRVAATPGGLSRTASQAIGYREVLAHLGGESTLDAALDAAALRTRKFARRQRMWFRRDPRLHWIGAATNPEHLAPAILATWTGSIPVRV